MSLARGPGLGKGHALSGGAGDRDVTEPAD